MRGESVVRVWQMPNGKLRAHDFNRLRYALVPDSDELKKLTPIRSNDFMRDCLDAFDHMGGSTASWSSKFKRLSSYIRFCDKVAQNPFEAISVNAYTEHLFDKQLRGDILDSVYVKAVSELKATLEAINNNYAEYFDFVRRLRRSQGNSHEGYSQRELELLVVTLYDLFSQLFSAYKADPTGFIGTKWQSVATVQIDEKRHRVTGALSRFVAAGAYLMSFFTGLNSSVLLKMTRELETTVIDGKRYLKYTQVKPRARYAHVSTPIPEKSDSYLSQIFRCLAEVAHQTAPQTPWLFAFPTQQAERLQSVHLSNFNKWFKKSFALKADDGSELFPLISNFRVNVSLEEAKENGAHSSARMLDNQVTQVTNNYSRTSAFESESRMADSLDRIYQNVTQPIESRPEPQAETESETKRLLQLESIFKCFSCEYQALINEPYSAWLYLSLIKQLESQTLTSKLPWLSEMAERNFECFSQGIRNEAHALFEKFGPHPLWQGNSLEQVAGQC
jgi:hypothetical protein